MKRVLIITILLGSLCSFAQVGIGTTTPQSTLDINGNLSLKVVNYNGNNGGGTVIIDGIYINLEPSAGNLEFLLPDAAAFPGRIYIMRNISDSFDANINSSGGNFFAGNSNGATAAPITMNHVGGGGTSTTKTLIFISDGINWTYGHLGFN